LALSPPEGGSGAAASLEAVSGHQLPRLFFPIHRGLDQFHGNTAAWNDQPGRIFLGQALRPRQPNIQEIRMDYIEVEDCAEHDEEQKKGDDRSAKPFPFLPVKRHDLHDGLQVVDDYGQHQADEGKE
jgi:hypothetical protein